MSPLDPTPGRSTARTPAGGFSLVELLVASTLLLVAVAASMRAHVAARRGADSAAQTQAAARLLRSATALLESSDVPDLLDQGGEIEPGAPLALPERLEGQVVTYAVLNPAAADQELPVPVRITARWTGPRREQRTLSLVDAYR